MKSLIGGWAGALLSTGASVSTMKNFNPLTLSFWATMIGILVIAVVVQFVWEAVQKDIEKLLKKWHSGMRKQHLKHS